MNPIRFPTTRRHVAAFVGSALLGLALAPVTAQAQAQAWPSKPVRLVLSAPPGGTADIVARLLAEGLQKEWGQPVIVESKPGGAGTIGVNELLMAPADGYTLYVALNSTVTEIPHVVKVRYDAFKDIKPLVEMCGAGLLFVAHPSVPGKTLADAVAYVKANPGKISYASYSAGTISHTLGLELNKAAGLTMTHVPYRGSAPGLQDVMAGHVPFMFDGPANTLPMVKAGKVKVLAVSGAKRNPALPEVPTFAEQGYPTLDDTATIVLWSRPQVPADVQAKVRDTALKVLAQPVVKARLLEFGLDQGSGATPEELTKVMRAAYDKQGATLRALGVNPQDLGG
jgi:tripartite-type tricarboxylate transporter receptor subunit TctC